MEKLVTDSELATILARTGAVLQKQEGEVKVYVAKSVNTTISVFPGPKAGFKKVRAVHGCACG